ncbi:MAG: hypothetical protein MUC29_11215 [Pyrinomonadaceae bacterium]|jgi:hypothetical protein|nr:hypothetical protein [Pyrinomonadaceae bacterium]
MKFKFYLILVVLLLSFNVFAQKKDEYIGYKYKGVVYGKTLPNGVKDLGGGLLSNDNYGISHFIKGNLNMLWLDKITGRDDKGVPNWVVKDVLRFPLMKKNQSFLFSYASSCAKNKKGDLDMIVLAEFNAKLKKYKVLQAWKANLKKEKFEKISIKGIKCEVIEP